MKLTRERKIIGAVLVAALGFLAYDQFAGAGASSDAAAADAGSLLLASSSGKPTWPGGDNTNDISLATRLSALAAKTGVSATDQIRDAFRPAEGWINKPVAAIASAPTVSSADKFVAAHKLIAISTNSAGGAVAVVDGTLLHIGGAIDGYRLMRVDRQHAIFESPDGGRAQLTLITTAPSGSGANAAAR